MLVSVGLNQRRASLSQRELLSMSPADVEEFLAELAALDGVDEVAVLATCYRFELFAATSCPAAAAPALRRALAGRAGAELPLHELHGEDAFRHLVRVASGLESAVLGEPRIHLTVRDAFQRALDEGAAGAELAATLGRALRIAGRVRTETAVGRTGVSWGHAAAALAEKVLGPLAGLRVAVIGAGEMARACARHLRHGGASIAVLNRTLANGEALAREVAGSAFPLEALALDKELSRADVVVCAAPVSLEALSPAAMARRGRSRKRRIVVVDLAVPRAVPPETGRVEDVYLCDVDDLDRAMGAALADRSLAARHAEAIVEEEIANVSKLPHRPSAKPREAAREGAEGEAIVAAAVEILDLGGRATTRSVNVP